MWTHVCPTEWLSTRNERDIVLFSRNEQAGRVLSNEQAGMQGRPALVMLRREYEVVIEGFSQRLKLESCDLMTWEVLTL